MNIVFWLIVGIAAIVAVTAAVSLTAFAVKHWKRSNASIAGQRRRILSTRADG